MSRHATPVECIAVDQAIREGREVTLEDLAEGTAIMYITGSQGRGVDELPEWRERA